MNCVFCAAKIVQGRNNAVLCTIAQMANKREKDLLRFMKEPMVEVASPSKGVGQASSVVIQDPVLDKEVSVVTAAQKCPAEKSTQVFVPQVLHGAALADAMKEYQKLSSPAPVAGSTWECTGCTSMLDKWVWSGKGCSGGCRSPTCHAMW